MKNKYAFFILMTILLAACGPAETAASPPTHPEPFDQTHTKYAAVSPSAPPPTMLPITSVATAPSTPEAAPRTSPVDGMPQVYVPAGTVRMGGLDIHPENDEKPAHDVSLDAFWIDQLEVTNAMYMLCVQAEVCSPPKDWASDTRLSYFNNKEYKDYPVVHVTWQDANTYCAWTGRRLPTEAEWERAARGDDFRTFPWGDEPASETYANYNRLVRDTSRVGSYLLGASPFGTLDMAGNVWEWVSDYFALEYYNDSPDNNPTGPETSSTHMRVIRGGSFQDTWVDIRVSKRGSALGPDPTSPFDAPNRDGAHSSKIGFRCVTDE